MAYHVTGRPGDQPWASCRGSTSIISLPGQYRRSRLNNVDCRAVWVSQEHGEHVVHVRGPKALVHTIPVIYAGPPPQ